MCYNSRRMSPERENIIPPKLPANVFEQIEIINKLNSISVESITNLSYPEWLLSALDYRILEIVNEAGIKPVFKESRIKSLESIERKIGKRPNNFILADWIGIRHVFTTFEERVTAGKLIRNYFSMTPDYLPDGKPTYRDYADESLKSLIREKFNPDIYRLGSALHVNFFVVPRGLNIIIPCEYQSMTIEERNIYKATHGEYKNGLHEL